MISERGTIALFVSLLRLEGSRPEQPEQDATEMQTNGGEEERLALDVVCIAWPSVIVVNL
jgi:hypothetical protein